MGSIEANCLPHSPIQKVFCFCSSWFREVLKWNCRKLTSINLVKHHSTLHSVTPTHKAKEQLLCCKPKLSKQWKVTSFFQSQGFRAHTPEVDSKDIRYYHAERCAKAGDEYDSKYSYLTSSREESGTGNNSLGTRERCHRVPQIGFPTVQCTAAPCVPSWKGFLRGIKSVGPTGTGDEGDEPGIGGHDGGELSESRLIVGIRSGGEAEGSGSSGD